VRMRAAHEGGVQRARHRQIVDEAARAAQERRVLDARDAPADVAEGGQILLMSSVDAANSSSGATRRADRCCSWW